MITEPKQCTENYNAQKIEYCLRNRNQNSYTRESIYVRVFLQLKDKREIQNAQWTNISE